MTNKVFKIFSVVILMMAASLPLLGQQVLRLSLSQAKDYALEHNRVLENAGLAVDEAGAFLREIIAH